MQPHEMIRSAAKLIETQGWAHGTVEGIGPVAAADLSGNPLRLMETGLGGDSRARVSKAAWAFSIYGALVKAQEAGGQPTHVGLMWDTLYAMARELGGSPEGGTNYVHPVIQFNEQEGRTKEEVLTFMEQVAAAIEAKLNPAEAVAS